MKKFILILILITFSTRGFTQTIPYQIDFADVKVNLSADSRKVISETVDKLTNPKNSFYDKKIERMQLYFPIIEKILEEENVPDDLKYLAVVESSLNPDAVSSTNAVGFWQFKDFTAQEMGLSMDRTRDDRKNIHLSTLAAAQYLKKNNQIFKNWISTTISFNIGAGGAASIIPVEWSFASEIKIDDNAHPYLISAIANKLAFESVLTNSQQSNYSFIEYPSRGKSIQQVSNELNISINDIIANNSWLSAETVPNDKDYLLLIKTDKSTSEVLSKKTQEIAEKDFISTGYPKLKRLTMVVTSNDQPVFYEINHKKGILAQPGDEIPRIATKAKVKLTRFLNYNDLTDRDRAQEGLVYYLQRKWKKANTPFHTVMEGEDLWIIAHNYGVRMKKIEKFNRLEKNEVLKPGRILYLTKKRSKKEPIRYNEASTPPPELFDPVKEVKEIYDIDEVKKPENHIVKPGETLNTIADEYGISETELRQYNNLGQSDTIIENQILRLTPPEIVKTTVIVPVKEEEIENKEEVIPSPVDRPAEAITTSRHYVQKGETLFSLAKRYNMTIDELRALNNMSNTDVLQADTYLRVSGNPSQSTTTVNTYHTVSRGETLFSISKQNGLTVNELKSLNNLTDNKILVGQRLLVSGSQTSFTPTSAPQYYTVKRGDNLFRISQRFGVTVNQIKSWNQLNSDKIEIGDQLIVAQ